MNFIVKQHNEIEQASWDNFVSSNSMGWAYHLYDMIGIDRWGDYINKSFAILEEETNEILMVVQLHKTNHPVASKLRLRSEKLHSRWGYVVKDQLSRKQANKLKETFLNYIDTLVKTGISSFDINLPVLTESNINDKSSVNPLMNYGFKPKVRYSYVVDLSKPDDRMLADCEETTRQAIRKLDAEGRYEVIAAKSTEEDCLDYINLHKETYTRTNASKSIISDKYHRNMFFNLMPKGICKIYFLKDKENNEIIASTAILIYKNTAYYWWGNSKNEKEVGINKYLLFKVICITREDFNKTGYFETGGAYIFLRKGKYKGLNDFKKCFGTFLRPIWGGDYESTVSTKSKFKDFLHKIKVYDFLNL